MTIRVSIILQCSWPKMPSNTQTQAASATQSSENEEAHSYKPTTTTRP